MASVSAVILQLMFLHSAYVNAQQNESNIIRLGSSLSPSTHSTSWVSPSGLFAFGFYAQGNGFAVGIWLVSQPENTIVWTANLDDPPISSNATLHLTRDGKLLIQTEEGNSVSIADVSADSASMLDSGNFVLYNSSSYVIWQSFDFPTDTILGGQNLSSGQKLVSSMSISDCSSGRFFLSMQSDGNLVAYPVNSSSEPEDAYWASGTFYNFSTLNLDNKGILRIKGNSQVSTLAKNSSYLGNKKETVYRATLDADGIFRLYSHQIDGITNPSVLVVWEVLLNQCEVKGFCGLNSYYSSTGAKGDCYCYPGFAFVNKSKKFLGCSENYIENDCDSRKDLVTHYNTTALENVSWGDYPYSMKQSKKEDCCKSCQEDCNCGAVLYEGDKCYIYKLPIRYGIRNQSISKTAFFKVIMGSSTSQSPPIAVKLIIITKGNKSLISVLAVSLGSITFLCFVLAVFSFFMYRHRVNSYRKLSENGNLGLNEEFTLRSFSYKELELATDGFKEELGRGSFGAVYKGSISGGTKAVAVKRLEKVVEEGEKEFRAEMTAIGRTHHRNLVRLLGFCVEGSRKLLVYEYMSNGSLADILFKAVVRPIWKERVRIALDVARGILYLHEKCEVCIVRFNIKPQNILMDGFWTANISDFGLVKLLMSNEIESIRGFNETGSYLAPEWQRNAPTSVKVDVFSFGVVLLEIICCRSSIEVNVSTVDEIILSSWVYNWFVAGELNKLVQGENVDSRTLERTVKVGLWCVQDDPALRPSMKNVILMLEGTMDVPIPPSPAISSVV